MILSDRTIMEAMGEGKIIIAPFDREALGSNSYDVHLGKNYFTYLDRNLDCMLSPTVYPQVIPDDGLVLMPNELYMMVTQEYTETHGYVPFLEGKSSLGRLGVSIHVTAGKGDDGFCGPWTMEVTVVKPTRVYVGMPVGQLIYHTMTTPALVPYHAKRSQKYGIRPDDIGAEKVGDHHPTPSRMYLNTFRTKV